MFASSTNKGTLKQAYIVGQLGPPSLHSIDTIVAHLSKPWYQKIDGKPLVFIEKSTLASIPTILNDIQTAYGGPVYSVLQPIYGGASTDVPVIYANSMNAANWYST